MTDMLARRRLNDNFIDLLEDARRRIEQLERGAMTTDEGGPRVAGLALAVLDSPPPSPPSGHILIYAEESVGVVYLRAVDAAGTVKLLVSW